MDKIEIRGLKVFSHVGVFEEEKINGQNFIIDCTFELDTAICGDNLEKTIDYGELSLFICEFVKEAKYDLIEMMANELAKSILRKYLLIDSLTISIHKPNAPIKADFMDVIISIKRERTNCFLSIGSNLGDKRAYLDMVKEAIKENANMKLIATSKYYETEPYGVTDQPSFLNAVLKISTINTPLELLNFCKEIENKAGRVRKRKWGERTLDVDILFFGNKIIYNDDLKIPHPEIELREFVLEPLNEIEPYFLSPTTGKRIMDMLSDLRMNKEQDNEF